MLDLIDYTERLVRQEILTWPDGTATFTDFLGSDGVVARDVPIVARVTIAGDEVKIGERDRPDVARSRNAAGQARNVPEKIPDRFARRRNGHLALDLHGRPC